MAKLTVYQVHDVGNLPNVENPVLGAAMGKIIQVGLRWQLVASVANGDPWRAAAFGFAVGKVAGRGGAASSEHLYRMMTESLAAYGFAITDKIEIDGVSVDEASQLSIDDLRNIARLRTEMKDSLFLA